MSWRIDSPATLQHRWTLRGHAQDGVRTQHGTLVNSPTWSTGLYGQQVLELNGNNQYINLGNVTALNSVSAFTVSFWMEQDVLDQTDQLFIKYADVNEQVSMATVNDGNIYINLRNGAASYATIDYSTVISALNWHHGAMVFDGSLTGNAERLKLYIDAALVSLVFPGSAIPAATSDLSSADMRVGTSSNSFDGRLGDVRVYSVPLTRDEIETVMHDEGR